MVKAVDNAANRTVDRAKAVKRGGAVKGGRRAAREQRGGAGGAGSGEYVPSDETWTGTAGDFKAAAILYVFKAYRVLVLWGMLHLVEKVYLQAYTSAVFVEDESKDPPPVTSLAAALFGFELLASVPVALLLLMARRRFGPPGSSFVLDRVLFRAMAVDYVASTVLAIAVGSIVGRVVQNRELFRYGHDGLRGIRAASEIVLGTSILLLAPPYYLLAA